MLAFMRQQIFWDGNKRTATLFANALLIEKGCGILEISELQMSEFNEKLSAFYRSGDDFDVAAFLYQNCIFGIDYWGPTMKAARIYQRVSTEEQNLERQKRLNWES